MVAAPNTSPLVTSATAGPRRVWITWEVHRRTRGIAAALRPNLELVEITYSGSTAMRYLNCLLRTFAALLRTRPQVLMVQAPSIVLAAFAVVMRPFFRYKLVVDAHNEAVEPYSSTAEPIKRIWRWIVRSADLTIVTNSALSLRVRELGGRASILPDAVPSAPRGAPLDANGKRIVTVISTYAADEPFAAILEATPAFGESVNLYSTGKAAKFLAQYRKPVPPAVKFTGFLNDADYWQLLRSSDVIVDLTLKDNCLVCGAYEAVAVGRPAVLSDNGATRELFSRGVIYTKPDAASIAAAVTEALQRTPQLAEEMSALREQMQIDWQGALQRADQAMLRLS